MRNWFYIPKSTYVSLSALTVIQNFCHNNKKEDITIALEAKENSFLFTPSSVEPTNSLNVISGTYEETMPLRGKFDLIYKFDPVRAYEFGKWIQLNQTKALGVLVGVDCRSSIPDLSGLMIHEVEGFKRIGILNTPYINDVCRFFEEEFPEMQIGLLGDPQEVVTEQRVYELHGYDYIVGPVCSDTYMAVGLKKKVIEFVPSDKYPKWYSKWDAGTYIMVYGEKNASDKFKVAWKRMRDLEDEAKAKAAAQ